MGGKKKITFAFIAGKEHGRTEITEDQYREIKLILNGNKG